MTSLRFLGLVGVLLLPLASTSACESQICLSRTCSSVLRIYVRHFDGIVPPGSFELDVEAAGVSYTCRNEVPRDLNKGVPCVRQGSGLADAGVSDAGTEPVFFLILGQDVACNSTETGSGLEDTCTSPGTSAEQLFLELPEGTALPPELALRVKFADGFEAETVVTPEYLDVSINGTGCPGVCQTATTRWTPL
jgi:hypothetical protein